MEKSGSNLFLGFLINFFFPWLGNAYLKQIGLGGAIFLWLLAGFFLILGLFFLPLALAGIVLWLVSLVGTFTMKRKG
ncbi:MAG: hypothetical protein R3257_07960 [bacterium]|nr:hypothetical protein [bacterium]